MRGAIGRARTAPAVLVAALGAASAPVDLAAQETARTHLLVVSGLGGSPEYAAHFRDLGLALVDAAADGWGLPADQVTWLAEDPAAAPGRIAARGTREAVAGEIGRIAGEAGPGDRVLLVLIGHGTAAGEEAKFNLPGPDLTPEDLAGWLDAFATQTVAIVNTASASGGFVAPLSGERRIVVTATRGPREAEWTHFPEFFVAAMAGAGADVDKDGRVSLLEAFEYARAEVARRYERENQLLTEHALLDDDGDGQGSLEASATTGDGRLAATFVPGGADAAARAADDPALADLAADKARLEGEIAALRGRSDEMERAAYEARLEELLVQLAGVNAALRGDGRNAADGP